MTVAKHGNGLSRAMPSYSWVPQTNHPLAPGLGVPPKKVYPWGVPPRVSSRDHSSHVISLHQSEPLIKSVNHVARSVSAHSSLISVAIQHGEFAPVNYLVLRADRHIDRDVEDHAPPADGPRIVPRPLQTLYA